MQSSSTSTSNALKKPSFESLSIEGRRKYAQDLQREVQGHVPIVLEALKGATITIGANKKMYVFLFQ